MTTYLTRRGPVLGSLLLAATLSACSGGGDSDGGGDDPASVLADARTRLDETPGVEIALTTEALPDGTDGVLSATGVGTHQPAFEGELKVVVNAITVDVPVVAVDGQVFATLPFTKEFVPIEASDYGAPDPADIMSTDRGISMWLTQARDVEAGDEVRDGDQVLTSYTGTLPGEAVDAVIPSADEKADFPVTFDIDDEGRMVSADVSGPFYGDAGEVEYTVELSGYGTEKDITAP